MTEPADPIDAYAYASGHPPSAARRVLVDFDKTIRPWGALLADDPPIDGAVEAIHAIQRAGYEVVILTSRASWTWWEDEAGRRNDDVTDFGLAQMRYVYEYLGRHGVFNVLVTAEKAPALVLFDDTAVRVSDEYPLAQAVSDWLKGQE